MLLTLAAVTAVIGGGETPLRVMFVGNSFTFVNELPQQLQNVARSLGKTVITNSSTHGGCTLYHQTPAADDVTKALLQEDWDYIVLQDYSALPTVKAARENYLYPAVATFAGKKKKAKIVMYMTWGYHDGSVDACPTSGPPECFPLGTLSDLTNPPCSSDPHYKELTGDFPCMGYSLARGYLHTLTRGADMVVPCGLAWQIVRAVPEIPAGCKALIDAQFASPLKNLTLPLPHKPEAELPGFLLYRLLGNNQIDKHPNVAGQYLNALTFYSALFRESPVGAAAPLNTEPGDKPLNTTEIMALQLAANTAVQGCGATCNLPFIATD